MKVDRIIWALATILWFAVIGATFYRYGAPDWIGRGIAMAGGIYAMRMLSK